MGVVINERELTRRVKFFAKEIWGVECNLPIKVSARMTRALGFYIHRTPYGSKEVIPLQFKFSRYLINGNYSNETIDGVIKHELCHWYLSTKTRNFHDGDREFENELKRIGSHSTGTIEVSGELYTCVCSKCGKTVVSKRTAKQAIKYSDRKYTSRCCNAHLSYVGKITKEDNNKVVAKDERIGKITSVAAMETAKPVVKPTETKPLEKMNNAKMIPLLKEAMEIGNQSKLNQLKLDYPELFEKCLFYIPKKLRRPYGLA